MIYIKNNVIDSDNNINWTVDSMLEINNIITGSNNITLRNVNIKPLILLILLNVNIMY